MSLSKRFLSEYPVIIETPIAWGDMDSFAHVNNCIYFKHCENGRIAYFDALKSFMERVQNTHGPILKAAQCEFKFPLTYPDTVLIGTRVCEIGNDRFKMLHRIVSKRHQLIAAEGVGLVVFFDYEKQQKTTIPNDFRMRILALEDNIIEQELIKL